MENFEKITVETIVNAPAHSVWSEFTSPDAIKQWNAASPDWHTTSAELDLRDGGAFSYRMEAKDGSFGFDLAGHFTRVTPNQQLNYVLADGRTVETHFVTDTDKTLVVQTFEAEKTNPLDLQKQGWQAILDNFKKYVEENW